jgi:DNA-binding protein YbaB
VTVMAWDTGALRREIDNAVGEYAAVVAAECITVEIGMVTAVMSADGILREILLDPRAARRLGADGLGELLTEAVRAAEREAAGRRHELAGEVTVLGHPVFELIDEMINNPEAAVRRMAAGSGLWR